LFYEKIEFNCGITKEWKYTIRSTFSNNITAKTHDRLEEMDSIRNGMKGFLDGFYSDKEVVFDKCRGWTSQLPLLDEILGH
jgi:hypothetical protein